MRLMPLAMSHRDNDPSPKRPAGRVYRASETPSCGERIQEFIDDGRDAHVARGGDEIGDNDDQPEHAGNSVLHVSSPGAYL